MRKITPVFVMASLAIAVTGTSTMAQTAGSSTATAGTRAAAAAPASTAPSSTSSASSGNAAGVNNSSPSTNVSNNGAGSNSAATQGVTAGTGSTAGQSSGPSQSGTSSGDAFSGSSRGNAPAVGSASVNAPTPDTGSRPDLLPGNPILSNDAALNANGERMGNAEASTTSSGNVQADVASGGTIGAVVSPELDRATRREAQRQRATVQRKGQMLNSITPRTSVDRTDQMADDPPSPALTPSLVPR
jgi:hypothetical protein